MRFTHVVRSFTAIAAVSLAAFTVGTTPASAITLTSPTEGQIVRGKVQIVVPKSSLSPDVATSMGFVAVKIDGRFVAAVGVDTATAKTKSGQAVLIYSWDSKAPINGTNLPEDQRYYRDGPHEIVVEGHGPGPKGDTVALEKTSVNIVLKNRIPQPNPAPPVKLRYRYTMGQTSTYKLSLSGEVLTIAGMSLSGGQIPVQSQYVLTQAVEDLQGNNTALLRYKVGKDGYTQLFGQVTLLAQTGQKFKSVYKVIDTTGRTLEENVLTTATEAPVSDCLLWLPSRAVQVGESWQTSTRLKLEGLTDLFTLSGMSTLESLEWERGHKCAKIVSKLTGQPNFRFLPSANGPVDVTSVAYFAYDTGKMIKNTFTMEINTKLDDAVIANLQQKVDTSGSVSTDSSSGSTSAAPAYNMGMPGGGPAGMPTGSTPAANGKPVKIRLTVTVELS